MPAPRTDLRTEAFVLKRTNFGESDRIVNLLTPEGKFGVVARGVRRSKAKLAGGIELFCVSEVNIHFGKSDLAVLTAARPQIYYRQIMTDLDRLTFAGKVLKQLGRLSEQVSTPDFYHIGQQTLQALDQNQNPNLIEAWFLLQCLRASGEEPNFRRDTMGEALQIDGRYAWDTLENALRPEPHGPIAANNIKFLRLLLSSPFELVARVSPQDQAQLLPDALFVARALSQK